MDSFWTFSTVALFAFGTVWCFEWETLPGPMVYSCAGDKVTFPWRFKAGDAELIRDIRWFFDGDFDSTLVGTETSGYFLPTPPYSQRVRQLTNGGLVLSDVTLSDAANYTVEVNLDSEGSALSHRHSVILQVGEGLMTQDKTLTVKQDPTALWDNSTLQWVIRLTCGLFTFLGQPPIRVTWITPALETMSNSGYDDGTSSVLVNEVKARLSLLEAEKMTLKSENRELKEQLRDTIQEHDEGINNLTQYVNEQLEAVRNEVHSLRNHSREQFFLLGPCNSLNHVVLSDARRAVTNDVNVELCDESLTPGWYRFVLDGTNAVIPTECVPRNHCGTSAPSWLDLQGNALPGPGQQTDALACAAHWDGNCCFWTAPITVRNCGEFFVYKLKPNNLCPLSFCAKKVDS